MPTSNGQVTSRDLRTKAVRQSHVFPAAIGTTELAALAVTVDKLDDPIFVTAPADDVGVGTNLGALLPVGTAINTITVTIPSWVGQLSVFIFIRLQITNTSGGGTNAAVAIGVNDNVFEGGSRATVDDTEVGLITLAQSVDLASPGSTITIDGFGGSGLLGGSTPNSYGSRLNAIVIGTR